MWRKSWTRNNEKGGPATRKRRHLFCLDMRLGGVEKKNTEEEHATRRTALDHPRTFLLLRLGAMAQQAVVLLCVLGCWGSSSSSPRCRVSALSPWLSLASRSPPLLSRNAGRTTSWSSSSSSWSSSTSRPGSTTTNDHDGGPARPMYNFGAASSRDAVLFTVERPGHAVLQQQ